MEASVLLAEDKCVLMASLQNLTHLHHASQQKFLKWYAETYQLGNACKWKKTYMGRYP